MGNVNVSFNDGPRIKLQNILYVPFLRQNLITDTRLSMHFTKKKFVIDKSPSISAIGIRDHSNGLYSFSQHSSGISINFVSNSSITELWHKCFGPLYYDGLIHLSRYKQLKGLPYFPYARHVCKTCLAGRQC